MGTATSRNYAYGLPTCDKDDNALSWNKDAFKACMEDDRANKLADKDELQRLQEEKATVCCNQLACSNPWVVNGICAPPEQVPDDQRGGHFGMAKIVVNPANQFGAEGFQAYAYPILYVGAPSPQGHLIVPRNDYAKSRRYRSEEGIL